MECLPCIFSVAALTVEEIVRLRIKMRDQDPTVNSDLLQLVANIKKYKKSDRRIILNEIQLYLENNVSLNNTGNGSTSNLEFKNPGN